MTKQPPYVTKLRLSNICRWLLALGLLKLCIFGALVAGYPLPELSLDFNRTPTAPTPAPTTVRMGEPLQETHAEAPTPTASTAAPQGDPQGAAAARAAADMQPSPHKGGGVALPTPPAASGEEQTTPVAAAKQDGTDSAWWNNLLQATRLPVPRLGVDQAAHAATLDSPPPPAPASGADPSPFIPPAQNIPRGQNTDGTPLPPRSTTARPLPAGQAGPQLDTPQSPMNAVLTPNMQPPAPKVDAYTPPDDPHRQQQDLARREQEVLMLKQQMEQRLEELQKAERKMQDMLKEAKELEDKKINSLVGMYTNMKPKQAARAIESLDERIAVKILGSMSPKQSGDILSYTDPKKTAKLTELISRMRLGQ